VVQQQLVLAAVAAETILLSLLVLVERVAVVKEEIILR
tara:strand:+ start:534 stop:647 length:114 start_codon:yes stop_codon:yes gene_type:complete